MKKLIATILFVLPMSLLAAGGHIELQSVDIDLDNKPSLQRGAKYFVNYCLSCHSAKQLRYSRMADDLEIPRVLVEQNLMFSGEKIFDGMTVAMRPGDAKKWFGVAPPDLSLIARSRGSDWLYTYLKSFYVDAERPFGVDNLIFPKVGMPHVLADLQGTQKAVFSEHKDKEGTVRQKFEGFELAEEGRLSPKEYDKAVVDLVNFMTYMAEPAKLERERLGSKVILFLIFLTVIFYFLKKEYWKDIH